MGELSKQLKQRAQTKGHIETPKREVKIPQYAICRYCEHVAFEKKLSYPDGRNISAVCKLCPKPTRINPVTGNKELLTRGDGNLFHEECEMRNPKGSCSNFAEVKSYEKMFRRTVHKLQLPKFNPIILGLLVLLILACLGLSAAFTEAVEKKETKEQKVIEAESSTIELGNWEYGYSENQCLYNFNREK